MKAGDIAFIKQASEFVGPIAKEVGLVDTIVRLVKLQPAYYENEESSVAARGSLVGLHHAQYRHTTTKTTRRFLFFFRWTDYKFDSKLEKLTPLAEWVKQKAEPGEVVVQAIYDRQCGCVRVAYAQRRPKLSVAEKTKESGHA
jgi:hypothetical protein